eukprot:GHRR01018039.1.p1 GENE.GHRR01018039.1~~GHRR01018039.1.p1  ORF type:complete len:115 (+),score=33.24 GHRR01018039.1:225-569(+)
MTDSEISIATNGPTLKPLVLAQGNDPLSADDIQQLQQHMHQASWTGVNATRQVLPASTLQAIILAVTNILEKEPTLVEVRLLCSNLCAPASKNFKQSSHHCCCCSCTPLQAVSG